MTGRRNRAQAATKFGKRCLPNWFFPPAPPPIFPAGNFPKGKSLFGAFTRQIFLHVWLYYGSKKLDTENFKLQRTAMKFGANIIWLPVYLFAKSSCLRGVENAAASTLRRQRCGVVRHTDLSKQPIKNHFLITSQPTNLRRTSGTVTLPSAF